LAAADIPKDHAFHAGINFLGTTRDLPVGLLCTRPRAARSRTAGFSLSCKIRITVEGLMASEYDLPMKLRPSLGSIEPESDKPDFTAQVYDCLDDPRIKGYFRLELFTPDDVVNAILEDSYELGCQRRSY